MKLRFVEPMTLTNPSAEKLGISNYNAADRSEEPYHFGKWLVFETALVILLTIPPLMLPRSLSWSFSLFIVVLCALLALWRPFNGLILLLSAYPLIFMYKRLQYAHSGVLAEFNNPISVLPQVVIGCLLIRIILMSLTRNKIRRVTVSVAFICAIILLYVFAVFNSFSFLAGIFGLRSVVFPMLLFFIGRALIRDMSQLIFVFKVMAGSLFIVCAYGLRQFIYGPYNFEYNWAVDFVGTSNVSWFLVANQQIYLRRFSILSTPFEFAAIAMIGPFVVIPILLASKTLKGKVISAVVILLAIISLFATGIRGAWFGFGLGIISWMLIYNTRSLQGIILKGGSRIITVVVVGIILVSAMAPLLIQTDSTLTRRILSLRNPLEVGQMQTRYQRWAQAFDAAIENPLGLGTGSSGYTARRFGEENALTPDSLYVQALIELGWIGPTVFVLFFLYGSFHHVMQSFFRRVLFLKHVHLAIAAIILAVAVHGLTTPLQEGHMSISWFWLLIGLGQNLKRIDMA